MSRRETKWTPGPWKAEGFRGGVGSTTRGKVIKAELPCMNGLRAWFTIAYVYERDDEERLMTEGLIGEAGIDARLIAAAPDLASVAPHALAAIQSYIAFIKSIPARDLEAHPYLPELEDIEADLIAALEKARGPA